MLIKQLTCATALAFGATAIPVNTNNATLRSRDDGTFNLHVYNNCKFVKEVAIYGVTPSFQMVEKSAPTNIQPGQSITIQAPFKDSGLRLSGHAEWGTAGQWKPQALFEFGYSNYAGKEGTAYDLSLMPGSDGDIGLGAYPIDNGHGSGSCESKTCFPWHCDHSQGWTDPNQSQVGSPADTVCCQGKTDFKIVWCP